MSNRHFSRSQRFALYVASDGRCAICGAPLDQSFHADHVKPYSKGGDTDVLNGQALCETCNLKKGASMSSVQYRTWQDEQYADFTERTDVKWYTLVATPGGGKTIAMLRCAYHMLQTKQCDFLIIVVPTSALKEQWKTKARELYGIHIKTNFEGYVTDDFDGIAITYQQMAGALGRDMVKTQFRNRHVFTILDEPHHMAESKSWGDNARYALEKSVRGILGTGTPFRSDDCRIPFVDYHTESHELIAHYEYLYADGLIDQVVRALFFRKTDATATWYSYTDEVVTASFYDQLNEQQARERLNATIDANSEYVARVLKQAHDELMHIRATEQHNAGMLVICKDVRHLEAVAEVYRRVTGDTMHLVSSSDEHGGSEDVESFARGNECAVGAVDMISEGVDIPRLRSLVYLTNVTAPMYFYQAIGRVVRVERGRELFNGYVYLPSDERLLALAHTIKERRNHVLEAIERPIVQLPLFNETPAREVRQPSKFNPISAVPHFDGGVYDQEAYSEGELLTAVTWIKANGFRIPIEEAAKILRRNQFNPEPVDAPRANDFDPEAELDKLGKAANRKAYKLAEMRNLSVKEIHSEWVYKHNGKWQKQETIDGLKRKIQWLEAELNRSMRGR